MTLSPQMPSPPAGADPVVGWLLDADPAIRWQVLRDLTSASADAVAAERSRVATEGWGRRLLDAQRPDGQWGDGVATPFWWSVHPCVPARPRRRPGACAGARGGRLRSRPGDVGA